MNTTRISLAVIVVLLSQVGCSNKQSKENDDIARAQKCLDDVPATDPATASDCLQYVEKYSSQQALILKCSILMTSGGLIESKIVKAYEALKGNGVTEANRNAAFMAALSLDTPNVSSGLTKAQEADGYCQATGIPGFKYLSGVVLAGTSLNKTIIDMGGGALDINNPAAINTAINNLLSNTSGCTHPTAPAPGCDTNLATLGQAVASLSVGYCGSGGADATICGDINEAFTAAGNNATNVGQAVLCMLKDKTFNAGTGLCNP